VFVDEVATEGLNQFVYTPDIFGVTPTSKVFYLDANFDDTYSIYFGRDIYGEQPKKDIDVKVQYRSCNGEEANGASKFSTTFKPNVTVSTVAVASGGAERENIESIKFFAPKSIQIQDRAVTASDYAILLRQRFPEIQSVSVYGGDELDPPQYGRVAITVNLQGEGILSDTSKNEYIRYIADKSPLTIEPIFIWVNGTQDEGTILNAYCINDNLSTSGTFYYSILSDAQQQLAQGNLTMTGEDYQAWQTNDYAYDWVAGQLNLTITGDYVPPVPPTPVPPQPEPIVTEE
jgi:hypothetical protein